MLTTVRRWTRALYDWTLRWSESPQALTALFLIALVESSIFPIPPDVLLIAIVAARPQAWLRAAGACTAGSAIGAALGYAIGAGFMVTLGQPIIDFYGAQAHWDRVVALYTGEWGVWFLAVAAFTPIPFKVATISAGATHMAFVPFVIVSLFGRAARFLIVAAILRAFGAEVRRQLERHFDAATLLFLALLIGGFVVLRLF
ncbi:MAG: VTT domain-containing protein [Acidobacteria bacterium]|nr:VTT domain-containing protein [Acidobacteriota bacterium]